MRILISSFIFCVISLGLYAQCTPIAPTGNPGFTPDWYSPNFDCVIPGEPFNETIFFENFSIISGITINSLRLDSIAPMYDDYDVAIPNTGIPTGLVYTTDLGDVPVTWNSGETGCISISGTADTGITSLGNWRIGIYVTLNTSIGVLSDEAGTLAESFNTGDFSFFLKVRDSELYCVDSIRLCLSSPPDSIIGINEIPTISNFSITPNPFTTTAVITFNSKVAGNYKSILTDIVGKEVEVSNLDIIMGQNQIKLNRGYLPNGIYLYTITNGKQSISKRLVLQN